MIEFGGGGGGGGGGAWAVSVPLDERGEILEKGLREFSGVFNCFSGVKSRNRKSK